MNQSNTIQIKPISADEIEKLLGIVPEGGNSKTVYILPETTENQILLNEHAPDLYKVAKTQGIPCSLLHREDFDGYLSLRDSEILLPFLVSLSAAACYDLLKYFISRFFSDKKNLKARIITEKKKSSEYREI